MAKGIKYRCTGCGRNFTSLPAFDAHHETINVHPGVECLHPESVGLVRVGTGWGTGKVVSVDSGPHVNAQEPI